MPPYKHDPPAATPRRITAAVKTLLLFAVVGVCVLAGVAFLGSFKAMADWSTDQGLTTAAESWTFPTVVDGAVIICAFLAVACALAGIRNRGPQIATLAALTVSVAVNVAHAPATLDAQMGAAVYPLVLAVCAHLVFAVLQAVLDRAVSDRPRGRLAGIADAAAARVQRSLSEPASAPAAAPEPVEPPRVRTAPARVRTSQPAQTERTGGSTADRDFAAIAAYVQRNGNRGHSYARIADALGPGWNKAKVNRAIAANRDAWDRITATETEPADA